jgi:hypothetical protein
MSHIQTVANIPTIHIQPMNQSQYTVCIVRYYRHMNAGNNFQTVKLNIRDTACIRACLLEPNN